MSKVEECWVIQRGDGKLFCDIDITENGYKPYFTKHIEHCINNHSLFRTKELAQNYINRFLQNCKPVKLEIRMEEKIEYTDTINYVATTQQDLVAGYIDELDERIEKLEQELAELKEKAIVPRFKIGQEIYFIIDSVEKGKIEKVIITVSKNDDENSIFYSITNTYGYAVRLPEEQIFATEQEAQEKLKEIQGNE